MKEYGRGLSLCVAGYGPVAGSCEHGDEPSVFIVAAHAKYSTCIFVTKFFVRLFTLMMGTVPSNRRNHHLMND
jgi:hypothetical protein